MLLVRRVLQTPATVMLSAGSTVRTVAARSILTPNGARICEKIKTASGWGLQIHIATVAAHAETRNRTLVAERPPDLTEVNTPDYPSETTIRSIKEGVVISRGLLWVLPLTCLVGLWLWQVLSSTPDLYGTWLLPSIGVAVLAIVVAATGSHPRRPRQLSLVVLAWFLLYCLWATAGMSWGYAPSSAWMETARAYGGLMVLALGLCLLTGWVSLRAMCYLLLASALTLVIAVIVRAVATPHGLDLLIRGDAGAGALVFPGGDPESVAALSLSLVWPMLWMAADPRRRSHLRGIALGSVFGLLALAVLAQAAAAWLCLGATAVLALVFFPGRLRMIVCALVPAVLMIWAFPGLNDYAVEEAGTVGPRPLVFILAVGMAVTAFAGMILALLEKWISVSGRMRVVFSSLVVAIVIAGGVYGYTLLEGQVGPPAHWLQTQTADILGIRGQTHDLPYEPWRVAWKEFNLAPWSGAGTGELEPAFFLKRQVPEPYTPGAGSWVFRALGENGLPGVLLLAGGLLTGLIGMIWPRFSSGWRAWRGSWLARGRPPRDEPRWGDRPGEFGWEFSLALAVTYWLMHGAIRPLWSNPAVLGVGMLLLSTGVASVDARIRVLWPGLSRRLASKETRELLQEEILDGLSAPRDRSARRTHASSVAMTEAASGFTGLRRSHRHQERRQRIERRASRQRRRLKIMRPPGPLSEVFRWGVLGMASIDLILLLLPFSVLVLDDLSNRNVHATPERSVSLARAATGIMPFAAEPRLTEAHVYTQMAAQALMREEPSRYAAAADNRCLALTTLEDAAQSVSTSWYLWYASGLAAMDLAETMHAYGPQAAPYAPGEAPGSLATTDERRAACSALRAQSPASLLDRARSDLRTALSRSPLEPAVLNSLAILETQNPN